MNDKDKIINSISESLLDGHFSLFCGAGVCELKWIDLFSDKIKHYYDNTFSADIYYLAELEKMMSHSESSLHEIIARKIKETELSNRYFQEIKNLKINQIWTTNYDNSLEDVFNDIEDIAVIYKSEQIFTSKLDSTKTIYKLNGSVEEPSSMVITKEDFYKYFEKQRLLFELLKRQLVIDTFLFLGYSFQDDLVLAALREIYKTFPSCSNTHYRFKLSPESYCNGKEIDVKMWSEYSKLEDQYYRQTYNIDTIPIESYDEIHEYLKKIYHRFCEHNIHLSGSFRIIDNKKRQYIEDVVDCLIKELLINGYYLYSGNGRGLGEIIVARYNKHNKGNKTKLVNRPLIFSGDKNDTKASLNLEIMKDCHVSIIIAGQDESGKESRNVIKQFQQFLEIGNKNEFFPIVIPIPSTGYAAEFIYNDEIYRATPFFQMNKEELEKLNNLEEPKEIALLITRIIKSYKSALK